MHIRQRSTCQYYRYLLKNYCQKICLVRRFLNEIILQVLIDNEEVESGELEADWGFLPPKKIKDPSQTKPADWDDKISIDDPEDKKPEDWDKPQHIPDPEATKPEDWDDEMDGEWEAPMIDNPEYKVRILKLMYIQNFIRYFVIVSKIM